MIEKSGAKRNQRSVSFTWTCEFLHDHEKWTKELKLYNLETHGSHFVGIHAMIYGEK